MSIDDHLNVFIRFDLFSCCVIAEGLGLGIDDDNFSVTFALEQKTFEMIGDQLEVRSVVRAAGLIFPIVITRRDEIRETKTLRRPFTWDHSVWAKVSFYRRNKLRNLHFSIDAHSRCNLRFLVDANCDREWKWSSKGAASQSFGNAEWKRTVIFPVRFASSVSANSRNNGSVISLFALASFLSKNKTKIESLGILDRNDHLRCLNASRKEKLFGSRFTRIEIFAFDHFATTTITQFN